MKDKLKQKIMAFAIFISFVSVLILALALVGAFSIAFVLI